MSRLLTAGAAAVLVALPLYLESFWLQTGLFAMAAIVAAIGLTLLVGVAGQLSLGHAFFVAIGAYGYAYLAGQETPGTDGPSGLGLPPLVALLGAVALAGLAGALFSPISGRVRGIYLGLASLGLVFVGQHILQNATGITGGYEGVAVEPFSLFGFSFSNSDPDDLVVLGVPYGALERLWYVGLVIAAVAIWYGRNLVRSRPGRALATVRDSEVAAAVMGVDVVRYKAAAFTVSSMYAGLGGVLYALAFGRIVPESFGFLLSVDFLVMIVIGGAGSVGGAAAGAVFVTALPLILNHYSGSLPLLAEPGSGGISASEFSRYVYGAAIVAVLLFAREGLAGLARRARPSPELKEKARMSRRPFAIVVLALALAACGKGDDNGGGGAAGEGSVKTGPGTTADTITLGYLPDLSGVFAPNGKSMMEGANLYWNAKNADGGICGRQIELATQDTGYDPQKAVAAFQQISGDVVGLGLVLGSSITSALLPSVEQEGMFLNFAGWTSDILPNENVAIAGTTYDIEAINAVDFLMSEHGIKEGDTIGHLYFEGDYGENALKGAKYAAGKHGLKIVEQKITPAETDMTGQVAAFRRAGVKAILFSAAPPQAASLAGIAASQKLDVPIVANGPGWTPQLLTTPAADALAANYYVVSSMAPLGLESEGVREFLDAYEQEYPKGTPSSNGSLYAYAGAQIADAALTKACENKDLTRKGVLDALRSIDSLDTGGTVAGTLDFTDPAQPPSRMIYIAKVSKDAPGGLAPLGEAQTAADAEDYSF